MPIDNKKIHKHLKTVSHINTVLAVLSLIGVLAIYIWLSSAEEDTTLSIAEQQEVQTPVEASDAVDNEELAEEYQDEINTLLEDYNFDDAARAQELTYEALELRVPAELKQMHLQVILALNEAQQGNSERAQEIITELQNEFAWFL